MAIHSYPAPFQPPFYLSVAKGDVPGYSSIHKFGANFDIDPSSDPESVWTGGGLYPWDSLDSAETLYIKSDDSADTSTIEIQGLDSNWSAITETVSMTGTTAVTTTNTFRRVYRMAYNHGDPNVGTITAHVTSATGTVVAHIEGGYGQTLMCIYTVPAGYTGYMLNLDASLNKNEDGNLRVFQRPFGGAFKVAHMAEIYESIYRFDFAIPLKFEEKTDIDFRMAEVETNDTRCTANFDMLLVEN